MKARSLTKAASFPPRQGFALVIVLICLVMVTIIIVAFFASINTERRAAASYAQGTSAKLLADSTVDIAIGQIKDATHGVNASGQTLAWASQPGMIRTYNSSGQAEGYYKLYSWLKMTGTGAFNPTDPTEQVPSDWETQTALYTDLNSPINGVYPIVDPSADGVVEGFKITGAPGSGTNKAPMPVQWLYMLQDGSLATATATGTGTIVNVPQATTANPIVGRIAFWTDDETSKVNINTAAGDVWATNSPGQAGNPGSFWDTPRTASTFEKTYLAKYQPGKNEYQRFPGHPATTYLSAIFPNLSSADIYNLAPRVAGGGSSGGTTVPTTANTVVPDGDRLYASVDELVFKAGTVQDPPPSPRPQNPLTPADIQRTRFFLTAHSRAPEINLYNQPRIVAWPVSNQTGVTGRTPYDSLIAKCGTLNGLPYYFQRSDSNNPTADLPTTAASTTDTGLGRNRWLISYLRNLTSKPVPGFSSSAGETFLTKYPQDRDQILTEIFDYVRDLNAEDTSVSGLTPFTPVGVSTLGTAGQGQVVPITDTSHSDSGTEPLRGFGRFPTVREATLLFAGVGQTSGTQKSFPPTANQVPGTAIDDGKTRVQALLILSFFDPTQGYAAIVPNFKVRITPMSGFTWDGSPMGFAGGTVTLSRQYNTGLYGGYVGASTFIHGSGFTAACTSGIKDMATTTSATPTSFAFGEGQVKVEILNSASIVLQTLNITFPSGTFPVPELAPLLKDPGNPNPAYNIDYRNLSVPSSMSPDPAILARFAGSGVNTGGSTNTKMWLCGKDVVRSVVLNTDPRLVAARSQVPAAFFTKLDGYDDSTQRQVHAIAEAMNGSAVYSFVGARLGKLVANADYGSPEGAGQPAPIPAAHADLTYVGTGTDGQPIAGQVAGSAMGLAGYANPIAFGMRGTACVPVNGVASGTNATDSAGISTMAPGDWDNGFSIVNDGAYINKADEGNIYGLSTSSMAYYESLSFFTTTGATFFSPNRQMPSPGMFGSLPTGVQANRPWQTLLFRPDPGGSPKHKGTETPKDHLIMDLFTMPVVEPYAISEPFSTAGKVNMNYQIVPFTYLTRSTGLRAVLRSEQIMALQNTDAKLYKTINSGFANRRNFLDLNETLKGFDQRFATGDIFRSATEICDIWLVPQGQTYANMPTFWKDYQLTGDNVRERPYANIYPRLTTKSNTFTVHYRVQTLKKSPNTPANQWNENKDSITGEYRGATVLERFLDPSDTTVPDYATASNPDPIDKFYKFRIVETRRLDY